MAYKRYGDEWEKEVLRNPKKLIVAMLRDVAKERDDLYAAQQSVQSDALEACVKCGCGRHNHPDHLCNANYQRR
jgi:hypothetical protein